MGRDRSREEPAQMLSELYIKKCESIAGCKADSLPVPKIRGTNTIERR